MQADPLEQTIEAAQAGDQGELERLIASSRGTPTPSALGEESEGDAITLDESAPSEQSRPAGADVQD